MRVWILSLLGLLLLTGAAWCQDEDAVEVDATVSVEDDGRSLRDEYRQWSGSGTRTTARTRRVDVDPDSVDDVDSVDDLESAPRNVEEWFNEDVANTDRDDWVERREVRSTGRYANYPEYDDDIVAADRVDDRMYDDYDRRGDRYWSRSYGDVRYYDSRGHGCGCKSCDGCRVTSKCGAKCGISVASKGAACGKCGVKNKCGSKCGDKCGKCVTKSKCACHKPAVKAVAKCGSKCGGKCSKCAPKVVHKAACTKCGVSRKCRKC